MKPKDNVQKVKTTQR